MQEVFKVVESSDSEVIIEVHAGDPLVVAKHPYVSSKMKYLNLRRERAYGAWDYVLTIIYNDGKRCQLSLGNFRIYSCI